MNNTKSVKSWKDGDRTPWGAVQSVDVVTPRIAFVSTAGHGGYMVPADIAQERIPTAVLSSLFVGYWEGFYAFEEDCDGVLPFVFMPELFSSEERKGFAIGYARSMINYGCWSDAARAEVSKAIELLEK